MSRSALIITLLIGTLLILGGATFYLTLKGKGKKMEKESKVRALPQEQTTGAIDIFQTETQASIYCKDRGGKIQCVKKDDIYLCYCIFPEGTKCEIWGFFRGECAYPPDNICVDVAFCEECGPISEEDLKRGWYEGDCYHKKKFTPGDWVHTGGMLDGKWQRWEEGLECDCHW